MIALAQPTQTRFLSKTYHRLRHRRIFCRQAHRQIFSLPEMNRWLFCTAIGFLLNLANAESSRRIGKLTSQTWEEHLSYGENSGNYLASDQFPDQVPVQISQV